jgi:membrane protein DedA with SNARE-associated domain
VSETLDFLARHGPLVLFVVVFVEQMGVQLPAAPWLLTAGALITAGKMHGLTALASALPNEKIAIRRSLNTQGIY